MNHAVCMNACGRISNHKFHQKQDSLSCQKKDTNADSF